MDPNGYWFGRWRRIGRGLRMPIASSCAVKTKYNATCFRVNTNKTQGLRGSFGIDYLIRILRMIGPRYTLIYFLYQILHCNF